MKKFKPTLLTAALLAGLALAAAPAAAGPVTLGPTGLAIIAGPYLQQVTQTSITIMWETNLDATATVEAGLDEKSLTTFPGSGSARIHEVTLTGLQPETAYFYRVRSARGFMKVKSKVYTFRTAVLPTSPFSFAVMGDNRTQWWKFHKITERARAERPDFVLNVGDVITDGRKRYQWRTEFLWPAADLMRRVPTWVSIGNHERDAHWFYDYCSYPPPENYYSFDYGMAHFTIVDSNEEFKPGSAQMAWLERDLAASHAEWKFVAHHHPPFSSDDDYGEIEQTLGDENIRKLVPIYEKYGVDVVFDGHIHDYERSWPLRDGKVDPTGVIYIQSGGGGAPLEDFTPTRSWFTAKVYRGYQFCMVSVNGPYLRVMAYTIDGKLFDFLEIKKGADRY